MRALDRAADAWHAAKLAAPDRSDLTDVNKLRYLRSYLLLRVLIGSIGLALPVLVWLGSALLPSGTWTLRGSLSAYYYSGMREVFTGGLFATGVFLIAYKVFEPTIENLLATVSGLAATFVAFFPTNIPSGGAAKPTPLQEGLGEGDVAAIHYSSATVFILSLAVLSHLFATWEANRVGGEGRYGPVFWKRVHNTCAITIVVACAFVGLNRIPGVGFGSWIDQHYLWLGEVVAVVAFGTSWLCKGAELERLVSRRATAAAVTHQ